MCEISKQIIKYQLDGDENLNLKKLTSTVLFDFNLF